MSENSRIEVRAELLRIADRMLSRARDENDKAHHLSKKIDEAKRLSENKNDESKSAEEWKIEADIRYYLGKRDACLLLYQFLKEYEA